MVHHVVGGGEADREGLVALQESIIQGAEGALGPVGLALGVVGHDLARILGDVVVGAGGAGVGVPVGGEGVVVLVVADPDQVDVKVLALTDLSGRACQVELGGVGAGRGRLQQGSQAD